MELRHLKIFCAVAEYGSFTAAAMKVHTVQSNVTMRVKELEVELNQQLFVRNKSGVLLTSAGRTFLGYARRILQLADESRTAMLDTATPSGQLRLGSMETTAAIRLPQVLTKYRERYPQVQLSLVTGTTVELIKAIQNHELDGAFVGGIHLNAALVQQEVFEEELVLVSNSTIDSLEMLIDTMSAQTVLVFRTGCFYRSTLENWFYQAGLMAKEILELGTLDGILSCVAAGMGVTLLPKTIVERYGQRMAIKYHRLPTEFAIVKTVFIRRNDTVVTPALAAFVDLARCQLTPPNEDANAGRDECVSSARTAADVIETGIH
ncbi:LysR family transcriptional regulator [Burkholderia cenocepacia]|jgi:DNA-binding transcriptional LysR family regulator|uniref:LysR family transcriptional regulator n=2 Tax=Burkholderia cenocepacia TaxID=95486 RepID=UPI0004F6800F|nr:LysR family transcriptional regulator [Burkholderia cenocepacia]AIO43859.1 HTH-type transcriptional regulator gltR [Burkholderia cepacia]KGC05316.1 HTH-type transcriptional regulator gltR [Burkholderia cepacia]MCG0577989.1 LysR substrate-binding domain-containing protein [Burkholderia cenocepacia]MCW3524447.1 LysR family transcriptional regulator [Burkholderia cenocepacia]MCW3614669.1 LysR family transcriptional regulator [Burkholderia cenocepacia]